MSAKRYKNLVPFGKETIDCLTYEEILEVLQTEEIIMSLITKINYDPKKYSNHNSFIESVDNDYGMIFDGKKWRRENADVILKTQLEMGYRCLEMIKEKYLDKLPKELANKLIEYMREVKYAVYPELARPQVTIAFVQVIPIIN